MQAYFVSLTALKLFAGVGAKGEALEKPLKYFALVNNVLMCAYSAWAFVAVAALVVSNWAPAAGPVKPQFRVLACASDRS